MKISIIGAGKMAHVLGGALVDAGHDVIEIYNRTYAKAESLADKLKAQPVEDIAFLNTAIDVLIIAVSDDAIAKVVRLMNKEIWKETIVVHTSGSASTTLLESFDKYGSFYPFQSMTIGQKIDFREVPILVAGNIASVTKSLRDLAESLSDNVHEVNDEQRGAVHIAGVFANNFTNQMIALAKGIMEKSELSFSIIKPLIVNTIDKLSKLTPKDAQTGPAVRGDRRTMSKHLEILKDDPSLQELYSLVSKSIIDLHDSED